MLPISVVGADIGMSMSASENEWSKVLSPREHEVALQIARGLSNKEVARVLGLRAGTVKCHVHNILQKLGETRRYRLLNYREGRLLPLAGTLDNFIGNNVDG
jgi:DNA-binding NarL/FixJ family response regulator